MLSVFDCLFLFCSEMLSLQLFCLWKQGKTKSPPPPSNVIAGRPKAALLFWFLGGF